MKSFPVIVLLAAASLGGCSHMSASAPAVSERESLSLENLVVLVRADPAKKPLLARALTSRKILMIPDPHSSGLAALAFYQNERSFIPIFSDAKTFDAEAYGTGFAGKAVLVDGERFASLLEGDQVVVLNPGHRPAIAFSASELKSSVRRSL